MFSKMRPRGSEEKMSSWLQVLLHSSLRNTSAGTTGWNWASVNAALLRELWIVPDSSFSFCRILLENREIWAGLLNTAVSPYLCICLKKKKTNKKNPQVLHHRFCIFCCPINFYSATGFAGNVLMNTQQKLLLLRKKNQTDAE